MSSFPSFISISCIIMSSESVCVHAVRWVEETKSFDVSVTLDWQGLSTGLVSSGDPLALTLQLLGSGPSALGLLSQLTSELRSINPFTATQADDTTCIICRYRKTTRSKDLKRVDPRQNNTDRKGSDLKTEIYRLLLCCLSDRWYFQRKMSGRKDWERWTDKVKLIYESN